MFSFLGATSLGLTVPNRDGCACEGCENPGCRHGGCRGRKPTAARPVLSTVIAPIHSDLSLRAVPVEQHHAVARALVPHIT